MTTPRPTSKISTAVSTPERVGVLGGTFDPFHFGHLAAARAARDHLHLDRVLLVVAGDPWQKRGQVVASPSERLALVEVAVSGESGLEACAIEIERGEPSVTADTLEALRTPNRDLFLILGADAVINMPTWRRLDETRDLATLAVMERAGELALPPGPGWRVEHIEMPTVDVSSSAVRAALAAGNSIVDMVPSEVAQLIRDRNLYGSTRS